ncbi:MAG: type IV pilus assembly protein PilM [Phycisphaerales bacterium]|nr:type IV pilus assembly protein PilM [Phycisphaerales bacterium]
MASGSSSLGGKAAWGIEIGAFAIKALRLEADPGGVRVSDFAVIPHKRVLSTPDLDADELIRLSLGQLISQKRLEGEHLVMSVPGHSSFARFAKLPPVEPKKIPDIVRFEAVQQIPFPIEEVEWDYQTFMDEGSPEVEVGLFAVTKDKVREMLGIWSEVGLSPEVLTLSPVALFNGMHFDRSLREHPAPVAFVDIGTMAADVVIAEGDRCWIRTFPLGGHHFTSAIAEAFKLSYAKAERLKQEAATSKYAKQIMQAMRPVFADLLQDLQRSLGYFNASRPGVSLSGMVGVGSTFRIPGLRKFIGQQLQIDVQRLDEFRRIAVEGREAAAFSEQVVSLGTAYGLAMQGLGEVSLDANLVPMGIRRDQLWRRKTKWFVAAAALAVAAGGVTFIRTAMDSAALDVEPPQVSQTLAAAKANVNQLTNATGQFRQNALAPKLLEMLDHRDVWPLLVSDVATALRSANPQSELIGSDVEAVQHVDPESRRLIELAGLSGAYTGAADGGGSAGGGMPPGMGPGAAPGGMPGGPGQGGGGGAAQVLGTIDVTIQLELTHANPVGFVNDTVVKWLKDNAKRPGLPYRITDVKTDRTQLAEAVRPGGAGSSGNSGSGGGFGPPGGGGPGGGGGGFGPGGGGAGGGGFGPGGGGNGGGGGQGRSSGGDIDGTLPEGADPYPPGTTIYQLPVTFTVELITPTGGAA